MKPLASRLAGIAIALTLGALALGGCVVRGDIGYGATTTVGAPDLVMISPGVYVIADYGDSIFYNDGWYWRYGDGYWYRSRGYTGGWVVYRDPPPAIRHINRPGGYVHYRPRTRDHRDQRVRQPVGRSAPPAGVQDRRTRDQRRSAPPATTQDRRTHDQRRSAPPATTQDRRTHGDRKRDHR